MKHIGIAACNAESSPSWWMECSPIRHATSTTRVIAPAAERGCDAVALACTEIPLLVPPEESQLPTLDSTRLLAKAALREGLTED